MIVLDSEKLWHNKAYLWFSLLIQDFLSSYKYAMKWVKYSIILQDD